MTSCGAPPSPPFLIPPCPPCHPPTPLPVPQVCPPPAPPPPCYKKPKMKGLHWAQTQRVLATAMTLSVIGGICVYTFIGLPRKYAYKHFYEISEFEDWAKEMGEKGLFQSVPKLPPKKKRIG